MNIIIIEILVVAFMVGCVVLIVDTVINDFKKDKKDETRN